MMVVKLQPEMFMLNPARGGASVGVWGRNPSAGNLLNNLNEQGSKRADNS